MPPLKNKKHEQFVQAFPDSANATEAYKKTYHTPLHSSAIVRASQLLDRPEVQNRLLEVFEKDGINDQFISEGLKRLTSANRENVQLGAFRTILEVRKDIESSTKIGIQLNIEQEKKEKVLSRLANYAKITAKA